MPFVAFLAAALGLASLAAFFGKVSWLLDLAASFRPQLAGSLLACAVFLGLGRWRRTAFVVALGAAVNLAVVVPLYIGPDRPQASELRVLSFNLLASNGNYDEVISYIRTSGADLVVLHEGTRSWERALTRANLAYEITETRARSDAYGTVVLAPFGSTVESFGFGLTDPRAVEIKLPHGVAVLAIHPLSPYNGFRASQNQMQLQFAADWASSQDSAAIVVGDFNSSPWSYGFRRLMADSHLLNSERGFGLELSYPARAIPLFQVPIDHLLYSDDLAVVDRQLGPSLGSDHFPLMVDLAFVASG